MKKYDIVFVGLSLFIALLITISITIQVMTPMVSFVIFAVALLLFLPLADIQTKRIERKREREKD